MTGAPGFLEFFVLEAGEYIEQLDGLLLPVAGAGIDAGPDAETVQRLARALRGSATMAKLPGFANVAAALERVGRALREGDAVWSASLRGAVVAAVDDLKTLLRSARSWSAADDQRAGARVADLTLHAPPRTSGAFRAPGERVSSPQSSTFLGSESANIAAGLELLTTRPGDAQTASNVLGRIRALRGVAEVKEVGALADVLEATEDAAHGLDSGGTMTPESQRVLVAATAYLRILTPALRGSGDIDTPSLAREEFRAAVSAWQKRAGDAERIVPIAQLFYEDGAPGVIETSPNPPTSPQARFRLEMVSLAEHLRALTDAARRAFEPETASRARRELVRVLRALEASAESFGEHAVAARVAGQMDAANRMESDDLAALDALASELTTPAASRPSARFTQEFRPGAIADSVAPQTATPAAQQPTISPRVSTAPKHVEVLDNASASLIDSTIAALDQLTSVPLLEPVPIPEDVVIPIEELLYRGRAALDRALEVRDALRLAGPDSDPDALEELFDLVELARAE